MQTGKTKQKGCVRLNFLQVAGGGEKFYFLRGRGNIVFELIYIKTPVSDKK
jgi:hypothetical protein